MVLSPGLNTTVSPTFKACLRPSMLTVTSVSAKRSSEVELNSLITNLPPPRLIMSFTLV